MPDLPKTGSTAHTLNVYGKIRASAPCYISGRITTRGRGLACLVNLISFCLVKQNGGLPLPGEAVACITQYKLTTGARSSLKNVTGKLPFANMNSLWRDENGIKSNLIWREETIVDRTRTVISYMNSNFGSTGSKVEVIFQCHLVRKQ